jgi:hypothetical protein
MVVVAACTSSSSGGGGGGGGGGGATQANVKCTSDTATKACTCEANTDRQLSERVVLAQSCDQAPSGVSAESWECCHDRDTSGYTTKCECAVWRCIQFPASEGGSCSCSFFAEESGNGTITDSCTGAVCTKDETECTCSQDPKTQFGFGTLVPSCANSKPTTFCRSGLLTTSSCSTVTWKPPPTPSTPGSCIRNGNACGPAKQANGNCCSGYCGENGTCEMK